MTAFRGRPLRLLHVFVSCSLSRKVKSELNTGGRKYHFPNLELRTLLPAWCTLRLQLFFYRVQSVVLSSQRPNSPTDTRQERDSFGSHLLHTHRVQLLKDIHLLRQCHRFYGSTFFQSSKLALLSFPASFRFPPFSQNFRLSPLSLKSFLPLCLHFCAPTSLGLLK